MSDASERPTFRIAILVTEDLADGADFYRAIFGPPTVAVANYEEYALRGASIARWTRAGARKVWGLPLMESAGSASPQHELYLYVGDPDALGQLGVDAGGSLLAAGRDYDWGDYAVYLQAPDGHVIVLARPWSGV